jgi:asparagine synthetase B (glutamine-hydrolysing)
MPNLVGIWNPSLPKDDIENAIAKQLRRVCVPHIHYEEYKATYPGFGAVLQDHGILGNGSQPAKHSNDTLTLFLDGELYNSDELRTRFRHDFATAHLSTPELCLALIEKLGLEAVNLFNGCFCIVLYNSETSRLTLISDRFGFRPLFYV